MKSPQAKTPHQIVLEAYVDIARNDDRENENTRLLVAQIATAYFSASPVRPSDIPEVIGKIATGLQSIGKIVTAKLDIPDRRSTPAQIRRSITPEALISFEDGRPYRTLARHLSARGLTPEQYREKWGLPRDYPMVAESYSTVRSELAKQIQLHRHGVKARKGGRASR